MICEPGVQERQFFDSGSHSGSTRRMLGLESFKGFSWASLVAQTVKTLPARQETWVPSLAWEDPLEEGMTTHSSILAWRIPMAEETGELQSMGSQSWIRLNTKHSTEVSPTHLAPGLGWLTWLGMGLVEQAGAFFLPSWQSVHLCQLELPHSMVTSG